MDFLGMMKQAQQLQAKMQALQQELEQTAIEGQSGGGAVAITLNGKGDMLSCQIDPTLLNADETEILQDLLITAHADARRKAEAVMQEKMKDVTGGMGMPGGGGGGFKLPWS